MEAFGPLTTMNHPVIIDVIVMAVQLIFVLKNMTFSTMSSLPVLDVVLICLHALTVHVVSAVISSRWATGKVFQLIKNMLPNSNQVSHFVAENLLK